jgi:DNA-binding NarL/FixJ family response regulator
VVSFVLVVDDHPVFCAAMLMVVEAAEPGTQVKSVADLAAAEVVVRKQGFDLILLDMALPDVQGMSGLLLLRQLQPAAPIAIVSARDDAQLVRRSAECGARGFIPKSMPIELMVNAVKVFLAGGQWFPEGTFATDISAEERAFAARFRQLSSAQLRILRAIADGRMNKQIAHDLGIAETTVKSHLQAIFRKLGVANRMQAVVALNSFDLIPEA